MIVSFRVGGDCSGSSFFLVNVERRGARNLSIIEGALLLLLSSRSDVASAVESTTSDVHELVPVNPLYPIVPKSIFPSQPDKRAFRHCFTFTTATKVFEV